MTYCCAIKNCGNPKCPVCSVNTRFPPVVACTKLGMVKPCRFVAGHQGECEVKR